MSTPAEDLICACRILDGERLTDAFGHASIRIDGGLLLSPKVGPGLVNAAQQLLRLSEDGTLVDGDFSLMPAEAPIHHTIMRVRADVGAVCRFHGSACMAWATLGRPLPTTIGMGLALGTSVPVHDTTKTIATEVQATQLAATLGDGSAVLLRGFGAITVGRTMAEAVVRAVALERTAAAVLAASAVAQPLVYPPEVAEELAAHDVILVGQIQRYWNYLTLRHARPPAAASAMTQPAIDRDLNHERSAMPPETIWLDMSGGGVAERFYDANGVRTRVLEAGDGPVLLLLHGTGGHAETYYRNIVPLSRHFRVLAVDMVGHGYTDRPDIGYSLDDFAGHIADLLDAIGAGDDRVFVSGESLGSAVAAWFAITHAHRVERLVLNTAVLAPPTPEGLAELEEFARRTVEVMSSGFTREAVRTRMEWLVADPSRMTEELVSCRMKIYQQPGMLQTIGKVMMSVGGLFRGVSGQRYLEPGVMSRILCPTLVLWTEHNPGQNAEFARNVAADIPEHTFHVLTECGHWPQFENPDEFNRLHLEFLAAGHAAPTG